MSPRKTNAGARFSTESRASFQPAKALKTHLAAMALFLSAASFAFSSCVVNSSGTQVVICSPANGATVQSPVLLEAATSSSLRSFQAVIDGKIAYRADSNTISQQFSLTQGQHSISVQAKGASGPWITSTVSITVASPPTVSVTVSPASASVFTSGIQSFTATVNGSANTAVNWSVNGVAGGNSTLGTISTTGLYTAPSSVPNPSTVTVMATSQADSTKSANAAVAISVPQSVAVSLSPTSVSLQTGGSQQFTPTVTGTSNTAVTWATTGGTFSSPGSGSPANSTLYTAPASAGPYTVTATSLADPTKSASATVSAIQLAITPSTVTLLNSGPRTQIFNATVSGSSSPVNFSASAGTISPAGNSATFTAPTGSGTYTVTAALADNPSISASATVTVVLPSLTIYEVDGIAQPNRPITFGRVFAQGDIAQCPQPVVGGTGGIGGTPAANWQADVKNRWPDGSVKFAIISLTQSLAATSSTEVSFQSVASVNGGCNNTGALTQAQMTGFNSGNWGAQMVVTPADGAAVTTDAKTMLAASDPAANTFGDCKNDYWLKGPVVTAVIVQDCTNASANDFGWAWNGTSMGAVATGNAPTASFHPMFILYFYPTTNAVQVEYIAELSSSTRGQDQLADVAFRTSATPSTVWSHIGARRLTDISANAGSTQITSATANFTSTDVGLPIFISGSSQFDWYTIASVTNSTTAQLSAVLGGAGGTNLTTYINLQVFGTRHRKTFWSGTAPGHIRIDHNFSYLKFTKAIPNYDAAISVSPDSTCTTCTTYTAWATTDKGEIGGYGGINSFTADYSSNSEGAPLQREDLLYLYNMGTCGTANSACAKAWQELTAESGAIDTGLTSGNVSGGAGVWNNLGNVPFHMRESRTAASGQQIATNFFHCAGFEDKNVAGNSTNCNGSGTTNVATGRAVSRHAHSDARHLAVSVGTLSSPPGGWSVGNPGCDHWLDYAYAPYLLTGSYYFLEEEYQSASYCLDAYNEGNAPFQSNGFFAFVNDPGNIRTLAWALQTTARAAFIAPDSSVENSYYSSMLNSNLEVLEGMLSISGTTLTPSTTNSSCTTYSNTSANRWDWGRCSVISQCTTGACAPIVTALHAVSVGGCPVDALLTNTKTSSQESPWQYGYLSIALSHVRELGFTQAASVSAEMHKQLEEHVGDSTYNPYLIGNYVDPVKNGNSSANCNSSTTDPFIATYAAKKAAYVAAAQSIATFDHVSGQGDFACSDHGYSLVARAAGSFTQYFGASSIDANCPGGICTAATTWNWLNTNVPYFNNTPPTSAGCGNSDEQIKFAFTPR
jgi:hypothetical protein